MTEPQELRSIDELFKNSFQNLPETPAESGWDTPSDRVWQHIQQNMPAPAKGGGKGWTIWIATLLTGTAVVALGLWWYSNASTVTHNNSVAAPQTAQPAVSAPIPNEGSAVTSTSAEPVSPKGKTSVTPAKAMRPKPAQDNPGPASTRAGGAAPLPGSKSASPNTTEERKMERANKQEAQQHH